MSKVPAHIPPAGKPGFVFLADVIESVLPKGHCPALRDHPAIGVGLSLKTAGNDVLVAVWDVWLACHGGPSNHIGGCECGLLPASMSLAGCVTAELRTLRRFDGLHDVWSEEPEFDPVGDEGCRAAPWVRGILWFWMLQRGGAEVRRDDMRTIARRIHEGLRAGIAKIKAIEDLAKRLLKTVWATQSMY